MVDASVIEDYKENIVPLPGGRSASKLSNSLRSSHRPAHKDTLVKERQEFEVQLKQIDELDDPLQVFIDYISWTHTNFPQGGNTESGLVILLERCTSCFRDVTHYKNDPRYLKVWLEYTNYSDSPRDIFIYLARKDIGNQLALYYEEFANYLEINHKQSDAHQIYELGIESKARPLARLERSFHRFKQRLELGRSSPEFAPAIRRALALKRGDEVPEQDNGPIHKKAKLEVFKDDNTQDQSILYSIFNDESNHNDIGTIKSRIKENSVPAKPWSGQVLKQKNVKSTSLAKFQVYRAPETPQDEPKVVQHTETNSEGKVHTIIQVPGKRREKVMLNIDLLYGTNEEYCMEEVLAMSRDRQKHQDKQLHQHHDNTDGTFMIPLKEESSQSARPPSPTITMFSRMANQEVIDMFNEAAHNLSDDESRHDPRIDENLSNYDGFVTETIQQFPVVQPATPPTDNEASSPFMEQPSLATLDIANPVDRAQRDHFLNSLSIPLSVYPGYNESSKVVSKMALFKEITNKHTKSISKSSQSAILDCCGETYCLTHELGKGGYGYVYLVEAVTTGELKALKVESPSSKWEFYILSQVYRRLIGRDNWVSSLIIKPEALYFFKDESYLFMDFYSQGTILDIINYYKNKATVMEEVMCIHLTIELLKSVEALHSIGILHGDLKADNCMIRFEDTPGLDEVYSTDSGNSWCKKSITLIDFGRAIDLTLYNRNVQFVSDWKTDEQDCPQMNTGKPWTYEADYYGLASIIHTMLFGSYIKIQTLHDKVALESSFKRYWQQELWVPLFDMLLNPYHENESTKLPLTSQLEDIRHKFEHWLVQNSRSKKLRSIITSVEHDLMTLNKKRLG